MNSFFKSAAGIVIAMGTVAGALFGQDIARPAPVATPAPLSAPAPPAAEMRLLLAQGFFQSSISRSSSSRDVRDREDRNYDQGSRSLDKRDYQAAIGAVDRVIEAKTARGDGAYYWKAYALNKLGRREDALAALAEIPKQYPQSRWLNDSKALEVEIKQSAGHGVSPENESDEDLKLLVINGLMSSDAESVIPLLEKVLADPKNAPRVKERALFVLAQNKSDRAHEIIAQYAKGGANPDLQRTAIRYLGLNRSDSSRDTLVSLYGSVSDKMLRADIIEALFLQGSAKQLVDVARKETDPELKRQAVQKLTLMKSKEATDYLMELLNK